jgi:hypothetical protein
LTRAEASGVLPVARVLEQEGALFGARSTLAIITAQMDHHLADVLLRLKTRHPIMLFWMDRSTFAGGAPAALPETETYAILHLLARRGVAVFALPAETEIRQLGQYRLHQSEGVTAL